MKNNFWIIILIVVGVVLLYLYLKHWKRLKISNVYFVSGAVKTGKTFVSVALAVKTYKKNLRRFYITYPLLRLKLFLAKEEYNEKIYKPMLYSNIKLRYVKHNAFTKDILLRQVRIPNKSVVLLDETSLIADSMLFKDNKINIELLLFFKLFGHYSHGGTCVCNSQTISDNHYSLKRAMGRYLYVYNRTKFPFFTRMLAVERIYSDDANNVNLVEGDLEDSQKKLLFLNRYYRYYDCYCYSVFTDDLTIQVDYDKRVYKKLDSLKTDDLVTLQNFDDLLDTRKRKQK